MYWFRIEQTLQPTEREPAAGECAAVLLSSAELERKPALSGLESVLHHTPTARGVRVCKAELRRDCVSGTLLIPQAWKDGSTCGTLPRKSAGRTAALAASYTPLWSSSWQRICTTLRR